MDVILWSIGLVALVVGSITDLDRREVPDWVSYGLMFAGGAGRIILAITNNDPNIFWEGLFGFSAFVGLGYLMFYAGQWGGGDSKLLMGLGAIIGLSWELNNPLLGFWINVLLVGSVYGLLFSIYLAFKHRREFGKEWKKRMNKLKIPRLSVIVASILLAIGALVINDIIIKMLLLTIAVFVLGGFYLFIFIKVIEKACMLKRVTPAELTEGDWIVNDVVIDGKRITGPKDLGIEMEQIETLKKLASKGKINKILIKEGVPFVPSFLFAYIIQWKWGSIISFFMVF